ncbi:MAG: hypothetical protein FJ033_05070 [Chloroflexi bacterium]|nr:hypothetical protein [Chloroflexota bacterium]
MTPEARVAAYTMFGTLAAFKVGTAIYVVFAMPNAHGIEFFTFTGVLWFGLVAIPIVGAIVFWQRRLRVRARRRALIAAEWRVDEDVARR